jgi:hypothetical protein
MVRARAQHNDGFSQSPRHGPLYNRDAIAASHLPDDRIASRTP